MGLLKGICYNFAIKIMMWTSALKLFYDCFIQPFTDTLQLNNRLGKKEILILSRGLKSNKEIYHYPR